jgi:ATP-dependent exoDNAse (exonuclease V) beta subunit
MHKAKGLEFPIVYLADPTTLARSTRIPVRRLYRRERGEVMASVGDAPLPATETAREANAEVAEAERLLYVAATRARDALILPRMRPANSSAYDRLARRLTDRLDSLAEARPDLVREVEHVAGAAEPAEAVADAPDDDDAPGAYRRWKEERAASRAEAARPSLATTSVTARSAEQAEVAASGEGPDGARPPGGPSSKARVPEAEGARPAPRPFQLELFPVAAPAAPDDDASHQADADTPDRYAAAGPPPEAGIIAFPTQEAAAEFGTFVHLVLSLVPLDADPALVRSSAESLARGAPEVADQLDAAVEHAVWALAHPLLDRARAAAHVQRELPVAGLDAEGVLIEGVVDLVFEEPDGALVVVDHKTGEEDPKHAEQLRLYAELLGAPRAERWALYTGAHRAVRAD